MSKVIEFFERVGSDAALRYSDDRQLDSMLAQMAVAPEQRRAVLQRDWATLHTLVGATPTVCCTIEPPRDPDADMPAACSV